MKELTIFTEFPPPPYEQLSAIPHSINRLYQLTENILTKKEHSQIVSIERKGRMLFSEYLSGSKHSHVISNLELLRSIPESFLSYYIEDVDENLPIIILTDAIRKGDEIRKVFEKFKNRCVTDVIGYLAKRDTIEQLRQEFPDIKFNFLEYAINEEEYTKKYNAVLRSFFSLIIEPIDLRPFNLYYFVSKDEFSKILKILDDVVISTFKTDNLIIGSQLGLVDYLKSKSYDLTDEYRMAEITDGLNELIAFNERISIRCRCDTLNGRLCVVVFPHTTINCENFSKTDICGHNMSIKQCDKFSSKPKEESPWTVICPACIHQEISIRLLNEFNNNLKNEALTLGVDVKKSVEVR